MAEYENIGGALFPKLPTPGMCAGGAGGALGAWGVVGALGVLGAVGAAAYFFTRR